MSVRKAQTARQQPEPQEHGSINHFPGKTKPKSPDSGKKLKQANGENDGVISSVLSLKVDAATIDADLDAIFKSSSGATHPPVVVASNASRKRKPDGSSQEESPSKKHKLTDYQSRKIATPNGRASTKPIQKKSSQPSIPSSVGDNDMAEIEENDGPRLKKAYVPEDETPEQRDARTIFIGNLPIDVAKTKPGEKQLMVFVTSNVLGSSIESFRFRSVAFKQPTSGLDVNDPKRENGLPSPSQPRPQKDTELKQTSTDKVIFSPAKRKKIAFIKGDIHDNATSINAYILFAHPRPEPDAPFVLNPYIAASRAVERCNGLQFMGRTLRVDFVGGVAGTRLFNERQTIFVGNLHYECGEEEIRSFFEGLLTTEMGEAARADEENSEDEQGPKAWVKNVRIIRDPDTQFGKGIAYIEFRNRECVDEVLVLDDEQLRLRKRTLRVVRCKGPTTKIGKNGEAKKIGKRSKTTSDNPPVDINARGDPRLGERLRGLDKETRVEMKQSDPTRSARRLAKKAQYRARIAEERTNPGSHGKIGAVLGKGKKKTPKPKAKVSRIRGPNTLAKRNLKK